MILYPRDQAFEVLRFFREFTQSAPDELTAYGALLYIPDGMPVVGIIACYCGNLQEGEKVMKPLREFGTPLIDMIQPMPFPQMQTLLDEGCPDGNQYYWKTSFLKEFNDEAIALLIDHADESGSPLNVLLIEFYGGVASQVSVSDTAFAQRQEQFNVVISAQWTDPVESQRHIGWARNLADALRPLGSGGYLLNAVGEESHDTIKAAFGPNYERLVKVKKMYDPSNFFRLNQNIKPED